MDIYYYEPAEDANEKYELCFLKTSHSDNHLENYKGDIVDIVESEGFQWDVERELFAWSSKDIAPLVAKINSLYEKLHFELSE